MRPSENERRFADDTFKRIFMNENVRISINISLKFVPKGLINSIPALVQIMAWRRPGDKPLSEPMMVNSLTRICVTRPQWVNTKWQRYLISRLFILHWQSNSYSVQRHSHTPHCSFARLFGQYVYYQWTVKGYSLYLFRHRVWSHHLSSSSSSNSSSSCVNL